MEPALSASCYGGRPDATRRGTDRRAALVRFHSLVRDGGLPWVAKLDIASFFDAIPHGPLLAALRLSLANVFLTAFDRALERAGIVFLRSLDDVTILAASPNAAAWLTAGTLSRKDVSVEGETSGQSQSDSDVVIG